MAGEGYVDAGANILSSIRKWLSEQNYLLRWRYVIPAIMLVWLYSLLGGSLKGVMLVTIMGVLASYSTVYKRVVKLPSAIELVTLGTVITAITYGPLAGALFGIITTAASEIISAAVDMFTLVYMFARGVIGVAAFHMHDTNIVVLGVLMVLLFNLICQPVYQLPGDIETKLKGVYFFTINLLFNFIAFFLLGGIMLSIVK